MPVIFTEYLTSKKRMAVTEENRQSDSMKLLPETKRRSHVFF